MNIVVVLVVVVPAISGYTIIQHNSLLAFPNVISCIGFQYENRRNSNYIQWRQNEYCWSCLHLTNDDIADDSNSFKNINNNDSFSNNENDEKKLIYYNDFDDVMYDTNDSSTNTVIASSDIGDDTISQPSELSSPPSSTTSTTVSLWEQLKLRQLMIQKEYQQQQKQVIMSGKGIVSKVACAIPNDWIRRCSMHTYPYIVIGSASDEIYIINIDTGDIVASSQTISSKPRQQQQLQAGSNIIQKQRRLQYLLTTLFGNQQEYDGGGTLALGIYHTLVFEATRYGDLNVYRYIKRDDDDEKDSSIELSYIGNFPSLRDTYVTSIYCSNDNLLWIGTDVGRIEVYQMTQQQPGTWNVDRYESPYRTYYVGSSNSSNNNSVILSIYVDTTIQCAVVTTNTGTVELFYYGPPHTDTVGIDVVAAATKRTPSTPIGSFTLPADDTDTMERRSLYKVIYPTCATIVKVPKVTTTTLNTNTNSQSVSSYVIVCGNNNGSLYMQPLRTTTCNSNTTTGSTASNMNVNSDATTRRTTSSVIIDSKQPFQTKADGVTTKLKRIRPSHMGWMKCITCMGQHEGLILTGALDGTIRLWDMNVTSSSSSTTTTKSNEDNDETVNIQMIYQLMGYKIWLNNVLWCDAMNNNNGLQQIISDGADNTIIVHDYTRALAKIRKE